MPVSRLLVLFLKQKEHKSKKGPGRERHCADCAKTVQTEKQKRSSTWKFLGFPLAVTDRHYVEVCTQCGRVLHRQNASLVQKLLWFFV